MEEPTLVSGTDGCGTKVKVAMVMDKHDTIGIDAVAMCVNDIACAGGEPLFFLDYIACGKNYPEKIEEIVKGVAEGCVQSEAALIGGETAEHPGLMPEDEYDLAGFAVGVVDKKDLLTGEALKPGDVLIGMAACMDLHARLSDALKRFYIDSGRCDQCLSQSCSKLFIISFQRLFCHVKYFTYKRKSITVNSLLKKEILMSI